MSAVLDERRQAMLREMGIRWVQPDAVPAIDAIPSTAAREKTPRPLQAGRSEVPQEVRAAPASVSFAQPGEPATTGIELMEWDALEQAVAQCHGCALCNGRRNTVFGVGDRQADWLIVGEAPGENEDLQGEPFVGQAGLLLDNMLKALGLNRRQKVYIANVLKCRPPGNRNPEPQEVAQCEPFLRRQVALLQPRIILAMGRFAVQALLQSNEPIGKLRGTVHRYQGIPLVVTYHPSAVLRAREDGAALFAALADDLRRAGAL